jgi:DNA repair protein RadC
MGDAASRRKARVPVYALRLVRERTVGYRHAKVMHSRAAVEVLEELIAKRDTEHFAVLLLNGQNDVIGSTVAAIGGMHGLVLKPRDVFKAAIIGNASAIIVGHNHPSNAPNPSDEDRAFTEKIWEASEILGIPILDHIIVTNAGAFFSFADHGLLSPAQKAFK